MLFHGRFRGSSTNKFFLTDLEAIPFSSTRFLDLLTSLNCQSGKIIAKVGLSFVLDFIAKINQINQNKLGIA
jgi:hypothetical protein